MHDLDTLINITVIPLSASTDKTTRIRHYISAVKDPYSFRVGDTPVVVRFGENGSIQELFTHYALDQYAGNPEAFVL